MILQILTFVCKKIFADFGHILGKFRPPTSCQNDQTGRVSITVMRLAHLKKSGKISTPQKSPLTPDKACYTEYMPYYGTKMRKSLEIRKWFLGDSKIRNSG